MKRSLYGNAASPLTAVGGGAHGHVGMIMKETLYATIATTTWAQPGTLAELIVPNNTTGAHSTQLKEDKDE